MASTSTGAEGGVASSLTSTQPPTVAGVGNCFPTDPGGTPGGASVTSTSLGAVTDDRRDGGDIDKPYPGGSGYTLLPS